MPFYLPFVIFLASNIHHFRPANIVLIHDSGLPSAALHTITTALHSASTPVICLRYPSVSNINATLTNVHSKLVVFLWMDLIAFRTYRHTLACFHPTTSCIFVGRRDQFAFKWNRMRLRNLAVFYAIAHGDTIGFSVWNMSVARFDDNLDHALIDYDNVSSFVASEYWRAFTGRLSRLPPGVSLDIVTMKSSTIQRYVVRLDGRPVMAGVDVGLDRIVADQIGVSELRYIKYGFEVLDDSESIGEMRLLDERLVREYADAVHHARVSVMAMDLYGDGIVQLDQFVIMAPRRVVRSAPCGNVRLQTVLMFVGVSAGFSLVRWFMRWMMHAPGSNLGFVFVDTVCRLLSNSPARWSGTSAAEQWMLVVVSMVAILMGCMCAGALYERLMAPDEEQFFKTLLDLCNHNVTILVEMQLVVGIDFLEHVPSNCAFKGDYYKSMHGYEVNAAYMVEATAADIVAGHGNHYQLAQPYGHLPHPVWFKAHWILDRVVPGVLLRCFQHGLHQALGAASNHSMMLATRARVVAQSEPVVWEIDMALVLHGWALACAVFAVEVLARNRFALTRLIAGQMVNIRTLFRKQ